MKPIQNVRDMCKIGGQPPPIEKCGTYLLQAQNRDINCNSLFKDIKQGFSKEADAKIKRELTNILSYSDNLFFVLQMLRLQKENEIQCDDGKYMLIGISSPNLDQSKIKEGEAKIEFLVEQKIAERQLVKKAIVTISIGVSNANITQENFDFHVSVKIHEENRKPPVVVSFTLMTLSAICGNLGWFITNNISPLNYDLERFTCKVLLSEENSKYAHMIAYTQDYIKDLINFVGNGKREQFPEHQKDSEKQHTNLNDETKSRLMMLGMIPQSIDELDKYLNTLKCNEITRDCVQVVTSLSKNTKLFINLPGKSHVMTISYMVKHKFFAGHNY